MRDRIAFGIKSALVCKKLIDIGADLTLDKVMEKPKSCGLKFKKDKCKFRKDQISYVDYALSRNSLTTEKMYLHL